MGKFCESECPLVRGGLCLIPLHFVVGASKEEAEVLENGVEGWEGAYMKCTAGPLFVPYVLAAFVLTRSPYDLSILSSSCYHLYSLLQSLV